MARRTEDLEAGRRLFAAIISLQMDVSLDYAYRKYTPEIVDESWCDTARQLQMEMAQTIADLIDSSLETTDRIQ